MSTTTYHIAIHQGLTQKRFGEVKADIKRIGGTFDPTTKTWAITITDEARAQLHPVQVETRGELVAYWNHHGREGWSWCEGKIDVLDAPPTPAPRPVSHACVACGRPLTDHDRRVSALPGYHVDCA